MHNQIQFTKKVDEAHNSPAFLDVLIEKTDKGIKTSTYHKPTCTGHLTKFSSFSSLRYKRNLVNSLLYRSYSIGNSYSQIDTEFVSTKTHFCGMNIHLASSINATDIFLTKSLLLGHSWFKRIPPNIYSSYLT